MQQIQYLLIKFFALIFNLTLLTKITVKSNQTEMFGHKILRGKNIFHADNVNMFFCIHGTHLVALKVPQRVYRARKSLRHTHKEVKNNDQFVSHLKKKEDK